MLREHDRGVVAAFGAEWCGACKHVDPYFRSLSARESFRAALRSCAARRSLPVRARPPGASWTLCPSSTFWHLALYHAEGKRWIKGTIPSIFEEQIG